MGGDVLTVKLMQKKEGCFSNQTYTVTCSEKAYEKSLHGARVSISAADFEYYLLSELLQNFCLLSEIARFCSNREYVISVHPLLKKFLCLKITLANLLMFP